MKGKIYTLFKFNVLNILIFSICILIINFSNKNVTDIKNNLNLLNNNIEQHWRTQARYAIDDIIFQLESEYDNGNLDINDNIKLNEFAELRFNNIKNGGVSTECLIADVYTEEIIFKNNENMLLNNNIICFTEEVFDIDNYSKLECILECIKLGKPNDLEDNIIWDVNGNDVWVEFGFYPIEITRDIKCGKSRQVVIIIETFIDDIYENYNDYFNQQELIIIDIYIVLIFSIILSITLLTVIFLKHVDRGNGIGRRE